MNIVIPDSVNAKLKGMISRGIKEAEVDEDGHLILTLTDNSEADLGSVVGPSGPDGFAPTATVTKVGKIATITITDKNGTTTAQISDGEGGGGGSTVVMVDNPSGGVDLTVDGTTKTLAKESELPTVPTKTSDLVNDSGFLTEHQSLSGYATESWVGNQGYLTSHQDISGKANTADLSSVAFSGDYDDLNGTPTIPTALSDLTDDLGSNPTHTHSQYLTSHQSLSGYATETWVGQQGYLTSHQSLANYYTKSEADSAIAAHHDSTKVSEPSSEGTDGQVLATHGDGTRYWKSVSGGGGGTSDYSELTNKPQINSITLTGNKTSANLGLAAASHTHASSDVTGLAAVATSGDYDDLIGTPTIPDVTEYTANEVIALWNSL